MTDESHRKIGFWTATSLVIGTVVGSGIFMLPASMAAFGAIGLLGWAMSGIGALCLALCFARLSRRMPKAGGPYAYCRQAYGDMVAFQVATSYWVRSIVSVSAISIACASYMSSLMPELMGEPHARTLVAICLVFALGGMNLMGIKPVGVFQIVTSAVKLIPLIFMAFIGILFIDTSHFTPLNVSHMPNMEALMAAAAITFFSFMGLESATVPSDDVINPSKTIPRATMVGTIGVIILYLASATAVMGIVPLDMLAHAKAPFSMAAERVFGQIYGPLAATAVTVCAIVSCLGALNGYLLLLGKMPEAAAHDNLFPRIFASLNKQGAPWFGLLTCTVGAAIMIYLTASPTVAEQFNTVCLIASFLGLFVYAYTSIAELVVMVCDRSFYTPRDFLRASIVGGLAFVYCIWAMGGAGAKIGFMGVLFIFATLPVYVWMCWKSMPPKGTKSS